MLNACGNQSEIRGLCLRGCQAKDAKILISRDKSTKLELVSGKVLACGILIFYAKNKLLRKAAYPNP